MILTFHTFEMKYNYFYYTPNELLIFQMIYNSILNSFFENQIIDHK